MKIFGKFLCLMNRTRIVHVFLSQSTQNKIFWNALNFEIPITQKKIVIGNFDGIYTKYKFYIPFDHNHDGYDSEVIKQLIKKYFSQKNTQYIFYVTNSWTQGLIPFLHYLPNEKIKSIMIYEESIGDIFMKDTQKFLLSPEELRRNIVDLNVKLNPIYQYAFHTIYPTTYYFGLKNFLLTSKNHIDFCNYLKGANLEDLSFQKLSSTLLECEKQSICKYFKFDLKQYKKVTHGKDVHIFILGHGAEGYAKDKIKNEKLIVEAIKRWHAKYYQNDKQLFFIKAGRNEQPFLELLKNNDIKIPIFPYKGPFEVLILANLLPKTVSGTDCSLYVNLPSEIIGTIYGNGRWTNFLKKINKITENQIEII